jgi:poly-beta-1,6-N-acetyl-D-glucosamine synthase
MLGYLYDVAAIEMSDKHGFSFQNEDTYPLILVIFYGLFVFRFITMLAVIYGTIAYFFNKKS